MCFTYYFISKTFKIINKTILLHLSIFLYLNLSFKFYSGKLCFRYVQLRLCVLWKKEITVHLGVFSFHHIDVFTMGDEWWFIGVHRIFVYLDRFVGNLILLLVFPYSFVTNNLDWKYSDHQPIALSLVMRPIQQTRPQGMVVALSLMLSGHNMQRDWIVVTLRNDSVLLTI